MCGEILYLVGDHENIRMLVENALQPRCSTFRRANDDEVWAGHFRKRSWVPKSLLDPTAVAHLLPPIAKLGHLAGDVPNQNLACAT
jgi:hypothetical protein